MEGETNELNEWELLHNSSGSNSLNSSNSFPNLMDLESFEPERHTLIQADYFSIENRDSYLKDSTGSEQGSVESDNPSWVDPETESRYVGKEVREIWPDSGSDRGEYCKFDDYEGKREVGFVGNGESEVGFEGIGGNSWKTDLGFVGNGESFVGIEGIGEIGTKSELGFVGNGNSLVGTEGIGEIPLEYSENGQSSQVGEGFEVSSDGENNGVVSKTESDGAMEVAKAGGEREKKSVVLWWKVPLELLKFCAFRVSPVWTFSMAAAVMGVVILTRRLYKLKKKSQALKLKVTMDDKKVSQFMSRAARLNEAFSVVKRVPVIRPALPAAGGLTQWPMMSLR